MIKKPEIPEEPKLSYRMWWPGLEHHATAIGYICMTYASLEFSINRMIEYALRCSPDQRRAIVDASGARLETRCILLLKLVNINQPSHQFFQDLEETLNCISGEIAPLRNRLIHDPWVMGETVRQWDLRSKLTQADVGAPKSIAPPKEPERSLETVWQLIRLIQMADSSVSLLSAFYAQWTQTGQLPEYPEPPIRLHTRPAQANAAPPSGAGKQPPPPPSKA